jgi:hypothetical protein
VKKQEIDVFSVKDIDGNDEEDRQLEQMMMKGAEFLLGENVVYTFYYPNDIADVLKFVRELFDNAN